jgi:hypothetical protein
MKPRTALLVERLPRIEAEHSEEKPVRWWNQEVYAASAIAFFSVLQLWAATIVLSTVTLTGLSGFAVRILLVGATVSVICGLRAVVRQSRKKR